MFSNLIMKTIRPSSLMRPMVAGAMKTRAVSVPLTAHFARRNRNLPAGLESRKGRVPAPVSELNAPVAVTIVNPMEKKTRKTPSQNSASGSPAAGTVKEIPQTKSRAVKKLKRVSRHSFQKIMAALSTQHVFAEDIIQAQVLHFVVDRVVLQSQQVQFYFIKVSYGQHAVASICLYSQCTIDRDVRRW
jgi:hypothetical protein